MNTFRRAQREAKNWWNNYTEVQVLVREATSNDAWGPSTSVMNQICHEAEDVSNYNEMFNMIWKRLTDYEHIKHVFKALVVIDYMMRHSNERFVTDIKLRSDVIRRLQQYKYFNEGQDLGAEVRAKADAVIKLVDDMDYLIHERQVAEKLEGRLQGYSHQYSLEYYGNEKENKNDPFQSARNYEFDNEVKSYDNEVEEQEEKPKKKKKKSKKGKKAKKIVEEEEVLSQAEEEGEHQQIVDEEEEEEEEVKATTTVPPKYVEENDFVTDLMNAPRSKAVWEERDYITGGMNGMNGHAYFDWMNPQEENHMTQEIALFDMPALPAPPMEKNNAANNNNHQNEDMLDLAFMNVKSSSTANPVAATPAPEKDAWDVAKEISVLDNLNTTHEERRWEADRQSRKARESQAPKLKDLVKQPSQKSADPFTAAVQNQGDMSMAIVPASGWNMPLYAPQADNSMAIVPYGSFPAAQSQYGYAYPYYYYPQQQQQSWN